MLDKNLIRTILLFEFKMSCKAVEITHNINNAFGPGTANKRTVQWWFKKFCKGNESHEDECSGCPLEVDNDQLRAIIEADPPTIIGEVAKELSVDHSVVVWHLKQIGKVKKLDKRCLLSWQQIKKIVVLKCCLLLFYPTTMYHFLIWLWRVMKNGFSQQLVMTSLVDGARSSFKALPKAKLSPKKCHSHCLVVCSLSDPRQLSESQRNHYIWEVGSANRWDAPKTATHTVSIGPRTGLNSSLWQRPTACDKTKASKDEWIGLQSFASSAVFTWPLANWLPLQASGKLFAGKMLP